MELYSQIWPYCSDTHDQVAIQKFAWVFEMTFPRHGKQHKKTTHVPFVSYMGLCVYSRHKCSAGNSNMWLQIAKFQSVYINLIVSFGLLSSPTWWDIYRIISLILQHKCWRSVGDLVLQPVCIKFVWKVEKGHDWLSPSKMLTFLSCLSNVSCNCTTLSITKWYWTCVVQ